MIGKTILLCILIISCVFASMSVASAVSKKMPVIMSLIPIGFTVLLGIGLLLVHLSI